MILLPDLIGLIVFSVKRKVIKKTISSSKLNHKSLIRFLGDYIVKHINQNSSLHEGLSLYLAGLFSNPETVKMLNQQQQQIFLFQIKEPFRAEQLTKNLIQ
jgi:hypothetical protein